MSAVLSVAAVQVQGKRARCWARAIPNHRDRIPADESRRLEKEADQVKQDPCFGEKIAGKAPCMKRTREISTFIASECVMVQSPDCANSTIRVQ